MTNLVPCVEMVSGRPVVSSVKIAQIFSKEHFNVMRDVRKVIDEVGREFASLNFEEREYVTGNNNRYPMYWMTRDGFSLLAMGFTGKEAMSWKVKYIEAFNAMEAALSGQQVQSALRLSTPQEREPLRKLCGVWARIARLHYPDCYTQVAGHFNLDTITTIPVSWIPDALAFVQGRIDEAQRISLEGAARWELPPSKDSAITEEMVMGVLAAISARGAQFPQLEKQSRRKPSDPVIQSTMSLLYEAAKATQSILEVLTRLDASKEQMIRAVESMVRRVSRTFVETSDLGA